MIQNEWVRTLDDLVSRRLMLSLEPKLQRATLRHLASLLQEEGRLPADSINSSVEETGGDQDAVEREANLSQAARYLGIQPDQLDELKLQAAELRIDPHFFS